jgi:hypothetical protein
MDILNSTKEKTEKTSLNKKPFRSGTWASELDVINRTFHEKGVKSLIFCDGLREKPWVLKPEPLKRS